MKPLDPKAMSLDELRKKIIGYLSRVQMYDPDKMDEYHAFIKDCLDSFNELININKAAFLEPVVDKEKTL